MKIECSELRDLPNHLRQHSECHYNEEVRLPCLEGVKEFRILERYRLKDRDIVLNRIFLYGTFVDLESSSAGLVCHSYDSDYIVAVLYQLVKGCNGKLRSTHVYDTCLLEHSCNLALNFLESVLYVVRTEYCGVVDCLP